MIINFIKKCYTKLLKKTFFKKQNIFYEKFMSYGFDNYIITFQEFYNKYPLEYKNQLKKLLRNLDEQSIESIHRFLALMLKLPLPSKDFLVKFDSIYNTKEIQQINDEKKSLYSLNNNYKKHKSNGFEKIEINVFKYHCGLKLIPEESLKKAINKIIIDGGAFWGDSALILQKYKPKKIICFEPNSINFSLLRNTIKKNNLSNLVTLESLGISSINNIETLNYISKKQNHGASFLFKPGKHSKEEIVNVITIDSYLQKKYIEEPVGIIKLDVEGFGLKAIEGARSVIQKHQPIISCAIYHNPEELFGVKLLLEEINPNYKFIIAPLNQSFILKELTLLAYQ